MESTLFSDGTGIDKNSHNIRFIFSSWRAIAELLQWLGMAGGIRMSRVNNRKFVIDFRSSQVRQAHLSIRSMVVKNALIRLPMKDVQ